MEKILDRLRNVLNFFLSEGKINKWSRVLFVLSVIIISDLSWNHFARTVFTIFEPSAAFYWGSLLLLTIFYILCCSVYYLLIKILPPQLEKTRKYVRASFLIFLSTALILSLFSPKHLVPLFHIFKVKIFHPATNTILSILSSIPIIVVIITGIVITTIFILFIVFLITKFFGLGKQDKILHYGPAQYKTDRDKAGVVVGRAINYDVPGYGQLTSYNLESRIISIDASMLSKTTCVIGDMGQGKSRLMKIYYDKIKELYPRIPVLIHDPKGEWLRSCYNSETDLIFSPYDKRSVKWDIWRDISLHPELMYLIAKTSILAHQQGGSSEDTYWINSATELLQDVMTQGDIYKLAEKLLAKKQAEGDNKTFLSTYSTVKSGLRDLISISLMHDQNTITLDNIIQSNSTIFLTNPATIRGENQGGLSIFLTAFLMYMLAQPDVIESQLQAAAIIDESLLFDLPKEVENAIYTMSRSKGLAIIASILALPQEWQRETHLLKAQTFFTFKCSDLKTRDYFSHHAGDIIYEEERVTESRSGWKDRSISKSFDRRQQKAIPQEIFNSLDKREYFLFQAGRFCKGYAAEAEMKQTEIEPLVYNLELKKLVSEFINNL